MNDEIEIQSKKVRDLEARLKSLLPDIALRRQRVEQSERRVRSIESIRDGHASAWQMATRLKEEVERFVELSAERDDAQNRMESLEGKLSAERTRLSSFRDNQGRTFARISERFSAIIHRLVGGSAKGRVTLTGKGLDTPAFISSLRLLELRTGCSIVFRMLIAARPI